MQIEIDIEKLVSRSIINGILNSENVQEEVNNVLESEEYQKKLGENIKARIDEILLSEDGKKQINSVIMERISESDDIADSIEDVLKSDVYEKVLQQEVRICLQKVILSDEGEAQILDKVKEYLDEYDVECDEDFDNEMKKLVSDILLSMMKGSLKRFKELNTS